MPRRKDRIVNSRIPTLTHIELQRLAYESEMTPSEYLCNLISEAVKGKFKPGSEDNEEKLKKQIESLQAELKKAKSQKPKVQTKTKTVTKEVVKPDPKTVKERDKAKADLSEAKSEITGLKKSLKAYEKELKTKDAGSSKVMKRNVTLEDNLRQYKNEYAKLKRAYDSVKKKSDYNEELLSFAIKQIDKNVVFAKYDMNKLVNDYKKQ